MSVLRLILACCVAATALSGCSHGDRGGQDGAIHVLVTLSRSGGMGPSIDHAPQSGVHVTVTDDAGGKWPATTNGDGEAQITVPSPGEYDVDISFCPEAAQHASVSAGGSATVRFDCIAP